MSTRPISTARQRELLQRLARLSIERSQAETHIDTGFVSREKAADAQFQADQERLSKAYDDQRRALLAEFEGALSDAQRRCESEQNNASFQQAHVAESSTHERETAVGEARQQWQVLRQRAVGQFEAEKLKPAGELADFIRACDDRWKEVQQVEARARTLLRRRGTDADERPPPSFPRVTFEGEPLDRFQEWLGATHYQLARMQQVPAARLISPPALIVVAIAACLASVVPIGKVLNLPEDQWYWLLAASGLVGIGVAAIYWAVGRPFSQRQSLAVWPTLAETQHHARGALDTAIARTREESDRKLDQLVQRRDAATRQADLAWFQKQRELEARCVAANQEAEARCRQARERAERGRDETLRAVKEKYPPLVEELEQRYQTALMELREKRETRREGARRVQDEKWGELVQQWSTGYEEVRSSIDAMNAFCDERFPDWLGIHWPTWQAPTSSIPALRFGHYRVDLAALEGGAPRDPRLRVPRAEFQIPAVLSFPDCPSLVLETQGEGRDRAVETLQNVMLRLLTSMPPGKVRFTVIDPVGLGQNFSAFMHLADHDERLIHHRIWTEPGHIQQRLADLTQHMEDVIQKYLRNEFASIQEYNESAGEVAEPFQILVIANFPANFSEESAQRLLSIASSGARCGVYTLISVDTRMKLPRHFELGDLENQAVTLAWGDRGFCWKDQQLARFPLELDAPPGDAVFTDAVRTVGRLAQDANRVEVPFSSVAAARGAWWQGDSRGEVAVPLGRVGAAKFQYLRLGKGTSQHVLVAGKTGSGKSTLMHVLITNLAIHYSPDEVQFYLIDFKKGVEFKPYAACRLPHARVIAIESEREFGLSVLERLDLELRRRGDLFREQGVQDVPGFRETNSGTPMPRILLIVDEFQELFVQDDKLAADASLLLDRLVRQGRAFGIHVLLGSQTLAGAYSLARATLGQMAVRIALQCSETDAHLILSEDNTAARLLGRPGEAIYNDANGLFEGNHPFQVVWLPDHEREAYIREVAQLADEQGIDVPRPVVFEGNVPADPAQNDLLRQSLRAPAVETATVPRAWLGAAVAIKDPTAALFRRQSGSHLLVVGQHEQLALGVLSNAIIGLVATTQASGERASRFIVLDGTRPEAPEAGFWNRFAKAMPTSVSIVAPQNCVEAISELHGEVARRMQSPDDVQGPIFLVVYNLPRFRELRKSEDFSFSRADDDLPRADKQFVTILREGAAYGVHVLVWCDTYGNLNRGIDRPVLREFAMRALFSMSATDSSNLMDSPAASKLGVNRALLFHEEQGESEKFRPYAPPTQEWLAWVRQQFESRRDAGGGKRETWSVGREA